MDRIEEQLDLFNFSSDHYKINKPIRIISFFSGIGFQEKGIKMAFPNAESWKCCEWAIPSILGYDAIWKGEQDESLYTTDKTWLVNKLVKLGVSKDYNKPATEKELYKLSIETLNRINQSIDRNHNLVNIMNTKGSDLELDKCRDYETLLFYSFPCQDLSLAGSMAGFGETQSKNENQSNEGIGTRSGLVWEIIRIIKECGEDKPKILICENVPQLHSNTFLQDFIKLQRELAKLGYTNFWKDMNSKNYGIPQNRNRTFMVSILNKNALYSFPVKKKLTKCVGDILEPKVDKKYFLSNKMIKGIMLNTSFNSYSLENMMIDTGGVSKTITTATGERAPIVIKQLPIKNATKKGYLMGGVNDCVDISGRMEYHRGNVQKGISQTLTTQNNVGVIVNETHK